MNDASNISQSKKGVILIVDDTPAHQMLLGDMLTNEGYSISIASDGLSALSQARSLNPDLILLDVCLPDMDGYTVCSTLKCHPRTRNISILFVSACDQPINLARAFEVGGVDYITKPIERIELLARVRHQFQFRRIQDQLIDQNLRLQQEIRRRYHLEMELKTNRDRWHLALQGSNDGLWDWDITTGSMYFSDRWQEIIGYEPGVLPPLRRSWQERVHPEDLEWVLEFIRYHLECVTPNYYAEYRLRDQTGQYRWVLDRGQAQWDDRGHPIRMSGSLTDVTLRHQSEEQLQLLLVTGQAMVQADDTEQTFNSVLTKLCQIAEWDVGEAWTIDIDREQLVYCWGSHHHNPDPPPTLLAFEQERRQSYFHQNQGLAGRIWAQNNPIWIENLESSTSLVSDQALFLKAGFKSAHGLPIYADGQILAVLIFLSLKQRPRNARVMDLTQAVASQLSSFMLRKQTEQALTRANTELQRLATLDGLTQLANRRKFDEYIHTEWRRALRDGLPISLLLCDVDHFKRYNDCYGHQAGDACLRWVAHALESQAHRVTDLAARYGGEEFAIILPNTDLAGALAVAEHAAHAVRELTIPHEGSLVSDFITVSIGVASTIPQAGTLPTRLIAQADRNLYQAKAKGRNCVYGDGDIRSRPRLHGPDHDELR
jgi:diguanylate cyclase (GGDEF)-like protein/PAS domain S-box-containing protein